VPAVQWRGTARGESGPWDAPVLVVSPTDRGCYAGRVRRGAGLAGTPRNLSPRPPRASDVASRRNAEAIRAGRVELLLGSATALPRFDGPFDKVLAVNVFMFWKDPVSVLAGLRHVMSPHGVIALTLQPRRRGATADDTRAVGERIAASLRAAGFAEVRTKILEMGQFP
jgi:SAM-dependent methyltransferase